jgi:HEAT repeat protein
MTNDGDVTCGGPDDADSTGGGVSFDVYAAIVAVAPSERALHAAERVAAALAARIRSLGEAAVEPLIRASRHRDERVRIYAFRLLARMDDVRVADRMLEALDAEEPLVAMYAIQKLSADRERRALAPLRDHIRWLERLTAVPAPARPRSPRYAADCLNRYFLSEARQALESLERSSRLPEKTARAAA